MVEFALIAPLFFALLTGIAEGALLMRDNLTVAHITNSAGRAASTFGNEVQADYQIIQAVRDAADAIGTGTVIAVVVFKATDLHTPVPASCAGTGFNVGTPTAAGANPCNVYPAAAFDSDDPDDFDCTPGAPFSSQYWCPTVRKVALNGPGSPPDYVGIYVKIRHSVVTGLFGGDRVLSRTAIYRLEPLALND